MGDLLNVFSPEELGEPEENLEPALPDEETLAKSPQINVEEARGLFNQLLGEIPAEKESPERSPIEQQALLRKTEAVPQTTPSPATAAKEPPDTVGEYLHGSLVELPAHLIWGAASWLPSQIARHGAVGARKIGEALDYLPKTTPEEQAIMGENIANWVGTLGGWMVPQTETAKGGLGLVGKAIEPVQAFSHWAAQGIDPAKYPNLHNLAATGAELGVFMAVPKVAKRATKTVQKITKFTKDKAAGKLMPEGEAKAAKDIIKEQKRTLREANKAAGKWTPEELAAREAAPIDAEFTKALEAQREVMQSRIAGAEGFSAIEATPEMKARAATTMGEPTLGELISERPEIATADEASIGFEKLLAKRRLREGERPAPAVEMPLREEPAGTMATLEELPEQGFQPRTEYAADQPGTPKVGGQSEGKVWKIKDGKTTLVEDRPMRKVWQAIVKPLQNEQGAITISFKSSREKVIAKTTKEQRRDIRELGKLANRRGLPLEEFLREAGMSKAEIKDTIKVHDALKVDRPMQGAIRTKQPASEEFDFFKLKEGEVRENLSKGSRRKPGIGNKTNKTFYKLPQMKTGWLGKVFKNPEYFFAKYKEIRPLLDQARKIEATIKQDMEIQAGHVKDLRDQFNKKKLREELGVSWFAENKFGAEAMKAMGKKPKEMPEYSGLREQLQPLFTDLFERVNEVRASMGKRKIPYQEDYLTFFAKDSFLQDAKGLFREQGASSHMHNLVMDSATEITARHSQPVVDATAFNHLKRRGLEEGVKLELDPLAIYSRYSKQAIEHVHWSPLVNFIKEVTTAKMTRPDGSKYRFADHNPGVANELVSWSNFLAGHANLPLPRGFEKLVGKATSNLTVAVLGANLRTALIQSAALLPTMVRFGPVGLSKAIGEFAIRKKAPIGESSVLQTRVLDPVISDMSRALAGTLRERASVKVREWGIKPAALMDGIAAEITWRAAWNELAPRVKSGKLSKEAAIRRADSAVVRTQSSGSKVDLSPVQRNALGKAMFLWQTYTINQANWIARDVLGIGKPSAKPLQTAKRVVYAMAGIAALNTLTEDVVGIQSPYPAPVKELMRGMKRGDSGAATTLKMMLEMTEIIPGMGSVKYGSSPLGGLATHVQDISAALSGNDVFHKDLLPKAIAGDKKAMLSIAELLGKTFGVTGTGQAAKATRGVMRGENLPRAMIGHLPGQYTQAISSKAGKKRRSGRRRSRRSKR